MIFYHVRLSFLCEIVKYIELQLVVAMFEGAVRSGECFPQTVL
ncbi:hypothetical protein Cpin_1361 [Chitinophaga pinensis DSM 2588]|uniref:Uncharacterized protein n=1 Tax=Chitinophaga pinensis (strain ATCC 43595 / DSM 2588 / LMG 13176 / NBRC 15968 / NCIMB 11800 / UQM 2034) TaxID=485918 RepID=A0A979G1I6_CHIPD|nr:hypothetical protein Cpin_1361 [Chitinophaga pinensis DSM 2588]